MAYLDTSAGLLQGLASGMPAEPGLSALELRTLQLSRIDGRATLRAPRRVEQLGAMLFGSRRVPGLANPRLEALRRFAILYRLEGAAIDAAEIAHAEAAGLSAALLEAARRIVDGWDARTALDEWLARLTGARGVV